MQRDTNPLNECNDLGADDQVRQITSQKHTLGRNETFAKVSQTLSIDKN